MGFYTTITDSLWHQSLIICLVVFVSSVVEDGVLLSRVVCILDCNQSEIGSGKTSEPGKCSLQMVTMIMSNPTIVTIHTSGLQVSTFSQSCAASVVEMLIQGWVKMNLWAGCWFVELLSKPEENVECAPHSEATFQCGDRIGSVLVSVLGQWQSLPR